MTTQSLQSFELPDGRLVDVLLAGDPQGVPLVVHHGTPGDATIFAGWHEPCLTRGIRLIGASRPGYATSTRLAGRNVAQVVGDVAALLDRLGHGRFVTAGWSGGGPHALACAALLADRCIAVATLAGVGPFAVDDLDFLADMGEENIAEFGAALNGEAALRVWLQENAEPMRSVTGEMLATSFGDLVPPIDQEVLVGGYATTLAAAFRRALEVGFDGWIDDDGAFTQVWGFDLDAIRAPVTVWQGDLDRMVPLAHGRWLAQHIPHVRSRMVSGQGHISLVIRYRDEVLDDLLNNAY